MAVGEVFREAREGVARGVFPRGGVELHICRSPCFGVAFWQCFGEHLGRHESSDVDHSSCCLQVYTGVLPPMRVLVFIE